MYFERKSSLTFSILDMFCTSRLGCFHHKLARLGLCVVRSAQEAESAAAEMQVAIKSAMRFIELQIKVQPAAAKAWRPPGVSRVEAISIWWMRSDDLFQFFSF